MRDSSARLKSTCLISTKGLLHWKVKFLVTGLSDWSGSSVTFPQRIIIPQVQNWIPQGTWECTRSAQQHLYSLDLERCIAQPMRCPFLNFVERIVDWCWTQSPEVYVRTLFPETLWRLPFSSSDVTRMEFLYWFIHLLTILNGILSQLELCFQ